MVGIGAWAAANYAPSIWQSWEDFAFDHALAGKAASFTSFLTARAHDAANWIGDLWGKTSWGKNANHGSIEGSKPPANDSNTVPRPATNALIGRLAIPRLNLRTMVREGTSEGTLLLTAGHIPGTSLPGQPGNFAVAAHRDPLFRALSRVQMGDMIMFETLNGRYNYKVVSIDIVKPEDVGVLKPGKFPELTLVTCYPFDYVGSAPNRFIVKARQVSNPSPATPYHTVSTGESR